MANVIDILINAVWKGQKDTQKATSDLRDMGNNAAKTSEELDATGKATQQAGDRMGGLSSAVLSAGASLAVIAIGLNQAVRAAKSFYGVLRAGSEIEAIQIRFDRLASTIGTTGDALRDDLGIATRGLVSDIGAMSLATDLMALGLVKTHDEAIRLASAASQLGFDMNQLVLTLTNQTTMRFDSLGVSVDGFQEKVEKLEAAGYGVNEAFKLAFLEQAEQQIERVGSRAETTAGQLDIMEAAWQNTSDAVKLAVLEGFAPAIERAAEGQQALIDIDGAILQLADSARSLDETTAAVDAFNQALKDLKGEDEKYILTAGLNQQLIDFTATLASTGATAEEQKKILESFGIDVEKGLFGLEVVVAGFAISWEAVAEAIEKVRLDRFAEQAGQVDEKLFRLIKTSNDGTKAIISWRDETGEWSEEWKGTLEESIDLANEFGMTLNDFSAVMPSTFDGLAASVGASIGKMLDDAFGERATIWLDFQSDITAISERESEQRTQIEETHEQRRTDIVDDYGTQREQQEADFQRRQTRALESLQNDINSTREDSAEKEIEIREKTSRQLEDLEQDHLDRLADIIQGADAQLAEAAGRLDAAAVVAITRQRDAALKKEEKSYVDSRDDIQRQLDEQLAAEREAAAERIAEMLDFYNERKKIEDEDQQIRLERQQASHDERLAALVAQENEQLAAIKSAAESERIERGNQFEDYWTDQETISDAGRLAILEAESTWWDQRKALIPQAVGPNADAYPSQGNGANLGVVGPNATNVPLSGTNVGGIQIFIDGATSPAATGDEVRDRLIELFGQF